MNGQDKASKQNKLRELFLFISFSENLSENSKLCYIVIDKKGYDYMLETKLQVTAQITDFAKLELYRLIGEGYEAMQEGRTSTIEEVRGKLEKREKERG